MRFDGKRRAAPEKENSAAKDMRLSKNKKSATDKDSKTQRAIRTKVQLGMIYAALTQVVSCGRCQGHAQPTTRARKRKKKEIVQQKVMEM